MYVHRIQKYMLDKMNIRIYENLNCIQSEMYTNK